MNLPEKLRSLPEILPFEGEFGAEVNSFVPFIHFLFKSGLMSGRRVVTYAGMRAFYFFLADDQYSERAALRRHVAPEDRPAWLPTRDDHRSSRMPDEWTPPYREVYATDLALDRPVLVIHNKYTPEWGAAPVNFIALSTLDLLFTMLSPHFSIVYCPAATTQIAAAEFSHDHQASLPFDEASVLERHPSVTAFETLRARWPSAPYNEAKLRLFASCYRFILAQGGNVHLAGLLPGGAICVMHANGSELAHSYARGHFQYAANPRPNLLVCRNQLQLLTGGSAFLGSRLVGSQLHFSAAGLDVLGRLGAHSLPAAAKAYGTETSVLPSQRPHSPEAFRGQWYRMVRADGSDVVGALELRQDGLIGRSTHPNETSWSLDHADLVFRDAKGLPTTVFQGAGVQGPGRALLGRFLGSDKDEWHQLLPIEAADGNTIVAQLRRELYNGVDPYTSADRSFEDPGYPHTHLQADLVACILGSLKPAFWLEIGSMIGGSAIRLAQEIKKGGFSTTAVCIDPFSGDVNMWAWERKSTIEKTWRFLALAGGRPTIYDRFLANVVAAKQFDIVLPIQCSATVGLTLLRRLFAEGRISLLPAVIYLDSAHEPGETALELALSWSLLTPGGVLFGDDWKWASVQSSVKAFAASEATTDEALTSSLHEQLTGSSLEDRVLIYKGHWILTKRPAPS